jgi:4-oxalocrotonate tautomerase
MPIIDISISEGRTSEQLRALVTAVHTAVLETVNARPEHVTVLLREVPRTRWAVGDTTLAERDAAMETQRSSVA